MPRPIPIILLEGSASAVGTSPTRTTGSVSPSPNALVIVAVQSNSNGELIGVTSEFSVVSGWTVAVTAGSGETRTAFAWAITTANPGSGTLSLEHGGDTFNGTVTIVEVASGYNAVTPIRLVASAGDPTSTINPVTGAFASAPALGSRLLQYAAVRLDTGGGSATLTPGPGWTNLGANSFHFQQRRQLSYADGTAGANLQSTVNLPFTGSSIVGIELLGPPPMIATGGTITDVTVDGAVYRVHTFTADGTFEITSGSGDVEYLIVAGGASGGTGGGPSAAGGGGAGGLLSGVSAVVTGAYPVTVGAGGAVPAADEAGYNGGNSAVFGETAIGGGGGGARGENIDSGLPGGSGGGGAGMWFNTTGGAGTAGQGYAGGNGAAGTSAGDRAGGGGGGAGEVGEISSNAGDGVIAYGGAGGDGLLSSITGTTTYYAGGGGGGNQYDGDPTSGAGGLGGGGEGARGNHPSSGGEPNTGGGGGGGRNGSPGGAGGSGIVIVRYLVTPITAIGGTVTEIAENGKFYRVHTFTEGGTFEVTAGADNVEYLIVGGGGAGGYAMAGGGGAGGLLTGSLALAAGTHPVVVGAGGIAASVNAVLADLVDAEDSSFAGITALAGGRGGADTGGEYPAPTGAFHGWPGGSGGGGRGWHAGLGGLGTSGQGNDGGQGWNDTSSAHGSGGGGGAGGVGDPATATSGGNGGDGIQSSITGTPTYYAGGGGGGRADAGSVALGGLGGGGAGGADSGVGSELIALDATPNTGGGGGGGGNASAWDERREGGDGGSGIVIIRYEIPPTKIRTIRYVNTASTAGGDGTTNNTSGANRAYESLLAMMQNEGKDYVRTNEEIVVYVSGGADSGGELPSWGWEFWNWRLGVNNRLIILPLDETQKSRSEWMTDRYRFLGRLHGDTGRAHVTLGQIQIDAVATSAVANMASLIADGTYFYQSTGTQGLVVGNHEVSDYTVVNSIMHSLRTVTGEFDSTIRFSGRMYNCTVIGTADTGSWGVVGAPYGGSMTEIKNTIVVNNGTGNALHPDLTSTTVTATATSDGTSPNGASFQNQTFTFTSATDFSLAPADTGAIGKGVLLDTDPEYAIKKDMIDNARLIAASAWDLGAVDSEGVRAISNVNELQAMNDDRTLDYALINDIDATETSTWNSGEGFRPIGPDSANRFNGTLNGQNYTIANLYINQPTVPLNGLFGHTGNTTTVENLRMTGLYLRGGPDFTGGIVGRFEGGTFQNLHVEGDLGVDVGVSGGTGSWVAGIAGLGNNGLFLDCSFDGLLSGYFRDGMAGIGGFVSGSSSFHRCHARGTLQAFNTSAIIAGGIWGRAFGASGVSIIDCSNSLAFSGNIWYSGGILGWRSGSGTGIIERCANYGSIFTSDGSEVGGIVGRVDGFLTVQDCYNFAEITAVSFTTRPKAGIAGVLRDFEGIIIRRCYSSAFVETASTTGGAIGEDLSGPNFPAVIEDVFWNTDLGNANSDGGIGKTTEELKQITTFTDTTSPDLVNAWDIVYNDDETRIWGIRPITNNGYPYLQSLIENVPDSHGIRMEGGVTVSGGITIINQ